VDRSELLPKVEACSVLGAGLTVLAALCFGTGCVELKPGEDHSIEVNTADVPLEPDPDAELVTNDPEWACLANPVSSEPPVGGSSVFLAVPIVETVSQLPPATLQVHACAMIDPDCLRPITEYVGPGPDGLVHVEVPRGFDGFLEVVSDETVPAMFFMHKELLRDTLEEVLPLISIPSLLALAMNNDAALDLQNDGLMVVRAYNCLSEPAAGVRFEADVEGIVFMFVEGVPRIGAEETDSGGTGGFVNVPPGFVHVTGKHVASGFKAGSESAVVRGQWLTYVDLQPIDGP
jgi:hypothetical protein